MTASQRMFFAGSEHWASRREISGALRRAGRGVGHAGIGGLLHVAGNVADFDQVLNLKPGAARFLLAGWGVEAILHVIVSSGGEIVHASGADVMIGEDQAVRRDEAGRGSDAHTGEAQMVEEWLGYGEFVARLDAGGREGVVEPHAFIGKGGAGSRAEGQAGERISGRQSAGT